MDLELRDRLRRVAHLLLIPALVLFAGRAILLLLGGSDVPGWSMAVVGILSGLAMASLVGLNWKTPDAWRTIAAVAVALLGHYVVAEWVSPDLGGAMVYLGTGFLVSLRIRWAQFAGMVAGIGALLRSSADPTTSSLLLALGAFAIAVAAAMAARATENSPPVEAVEPDRQR